MAINDILSVYRQSLASERQARTAEAQMALQALQFETQQGFRERGRQREDSILALNEAKSGATASIMNDASSIGFRLAGIPEIANAKTDAEDNYKYPDKIVNSLGTEYGFTPTEASKIYHVVNYYRLAAENPKLVSQAEEAAVNLGIQIAGQYDAWEREGADQEQLKGLTFLNALNKSGILSLDSEDPFPRQQSADVFLGVAQGTQMLQNISNEYAEFAKQDYEVQRPITEEAIKGDMNLVTGENFDLSDLANQVETFYDMGKEDFEVETTDDINIASSEIIESLDFLSEDKKAEAIERMTNLDKKIDKKTETYASLVADRNDMLNEYNSKLLEFNWSKQQSEQASLSGDKKTARKFDSILKKLAKELGEKTHHFQEIPEAGPLGQEKQAFDMIEKNPNYADIFRNTQEYIEAEDLNWLEELDRKVFSKAGVGKEQLSKTKSYEIFKLSEEIKQLNEQKELIGA